MYVDVYQALTEHIVIPQNSAGMASRSALPVRRPLPLHESQTNAKRLKIPDDERKSLKKSQDERRVETTAKCSVVLVDDVFTIVLSMLAPREMLRLGCCSKGLMKMVSHESVLKNAILSGGHSKVSMEHMMKLLKEGKVFFPSAFRLLRLACGQRCEFPQCENTVHTIRPKLGLFVCWNCFTKKATGQLSMTSSRWTENGPLRDIVLHKRTANYTYQRKHLLWSKPFSTTDGERAGPLVTLEDGVRLLSNNGNIEEYFASTDEGCDKDFLQSLTELCEQSLVKADLNQKQDKTEREARIKIYRKAKADKFDEKLRQIQQLLDPRWKHFALRLWWYSSSGWSRHRDFPEDDYNPKFESSLIRSVDMLTKLANAPAKGSQKKLIRIADAIDKVLEPIFNSGLHDFSFLSPDKQKNPFEAHLRHSLKRKYHEVDFVLSLGEDDLTRLKSHGPLMALACKLSNEKLLWKPHPCFAISLLASEKIIRPLVTDEKFAKVMWLLQTADMELPEPKSFAQSCSETFERTLPAFLSARRRILRYLRDPATQTYLSADDGRNNEWLRVKREEIEKVWVDKEIILQFLTRNVDHERLRRDQTTWAEARWLGGHW